MPLVTKQKASLEEPPAPEGDFKEDNICTNLMSLLAVETSGTDEPASLPNTMECGGHDQPPAKKKRKMEKPSTVKLLRQPSRRTRDTKANTSSQ